MNKVKCCNCDWEGDDETLSLFETKGDGTDTIVAEEPYGSFVKRYSESVANPHFFKGCPNCKTDGYLMDIDEEEKVFTQKEGA